MCEFLINFAEFGMFSGDKIVDLDQRYFCGCLKENSYLTSHSFPDLNAYEYRLPIKNLDLLIFPKIKIFEGWKCNDFIKIF